MESLKCLVCYSLISTACHLSCSHDVCFVCVHRYWVQAAIEDGSIHGFQKKDRRRECPQCRARVERVSRACMIDTLAETVARAQPPEDLAEWQEKRRDGLALAQWYETALGGNPLNLAREVKTLTIKVATRVVEEPAAESQVPLVVCGGCRYVRAGVYWMVVRLVGRSVAGQGRGFVGCINRV